MIDVRNFERDKIAWEKPENYMRQWGNSERDRDLWERIENYRQNEELCRGRTVEVNEEMWRNKELWEKMENGGEKGSQELWER